jgi:hypothetical protein
MKRPRLELGLDASRSTVNHAEAARVGALIKAARMERGLSLGEVGGKLLLAAAQVSALEAADADGFYSAEFYGAALRKYVAFVGLTGVDMDRVVIRPSFSAADSSFRRGRRSGLRLVGRPSRRVMVGAGVAVTAVAAGLLIAAVVQRRSSLRPEATVAPPSFAPLPPAPETSQPPALPPAQTPDAVASASEPVLSSLVPVSVADPRTGTVRVGQRTWVFVRYASGATLERTLSGGEELVLDGEPIYIAVGTADRTSIEIGGRPIDNSLFTVNGQLRVGSSQLARLASAR